MSHYKHLTLSEREELMYFLAKGYSMRHIAKELGRSASTISRELKRNTSKGEYQSIMAIRYIWLCCVLMYVMSIEAMWSRNK